MGGQRRTGLSLLSDRKFDWKYDGRGAAHLDYLHFCLNDTLKGQQSVIICDAIAIFQLGSPRQQKIMADDLGLLFNAIFGKSLSR